MSTTDVQPNSNSSTPTNPASPDTTPAPTTDLLADGQPKPTEPAADLLAGDPAPDLNAAPAFDYAELAPETLKEMLPEGFELEESIGLEALAVVNGATSRGEMLKGLLALQAKNLQAEVDATAAEFSKQRDAWQAEAKKQFGDALPETLAKAKSFISEHSKNAAEVYSLLSITGLSNNAHILGPLAKAGEVLSTEGTPVNGNVPSGGKSQAERLFPNTAS